MKSLGKNTKWIMIAGGVVIAAAIAMLLFSSPPVSKTPFISPFSLLPYVSRAEARETICSKTTIPLLQELCGLGSNQVTKNDTETIDLLFDYLQKGSNLQDYEQYLFGQLVFATLPASDSVVVHNPQFASLAASLGNFFEYAYAREGGMTREEFIALLARDLSVLRQNCPRPGDDAWVLTAMCSEYTWANNQRQPIYSKQYSEAGGPCVFTEEGEAAAQELYHPQSIIDVITKGENNFYDPSENKSGQIACTFLCGSFRCPVPEKKPQEPYITIKDYTEPGYTGEDFLERLLESTAELPPVVEGIIEQTPSQKEAWNDNDCEKIVSDIGWQLNPSDTWNTFGDCNAEPLKNTISLQDAEIFLTGPSYDGTWFLHRSDTETAPLSIKLAVQQQERFIKKGAPYTNYPPIERLDIGDGAVLFMKEDVTYPEYNIWSAELNLLHGICRVRIFGKSDLNFLSYNNPNAVDYYHYTKDRVEINEHPGFDHGGAALRELLINEAKKINKAIGATCTKAR